MEGADFLPKLVTLEASVPDYLLGIKFTILITSLPRLYFVYPQ